MKTDPTQFKKIAEKELHNQQTQDFLNFFPIFLNAVRHEGMKTFQDPEAGKRYGAAIRAEVLARLPELLETFEKNAHSNGAKVIWARNAKEANDFVVQKAKERQAKYVAKAKSMVTEELSLNDALIANNIKPIETDLGEFIIQLLDRPSFHLVGPAINIPIEEISNLFFENHLIKEKTTDPVQLGAAARLYMRKKFQHLDIGITGINMAVAETGTIINVENEGNIRFIKSTAKVQISIMSLEKVVPTTEDALYLLRLLTRHCTGQKLSAYVTMDNGPKKIEEWDGPEELYIILVDNGRTKYLREPQTRDAFRCIRCGACMNTCPIYTKIGGYPYGWTYVGPIGQVLNPLFLGLSKTQDLYRACTACQMCKKACPSGIDHPRIFRFYKEMDVNRNKILKGKRRPFSEALLFRFWVKSVNCRSKWSRLHKIAHPLICHAIKKNQFLNRINPLSNWLKSRNLPFVPDKTFNDRWENLKK